jgi:Calcineurin-like phosphoesterase
MTSRETATPPQLIMSAAPSPTTTTEPPSLDPVVAAAGDIACAPADASFNNLNGTATACRSKYTEQLIQGLKPKYLLPLGDEQYNSGSPSDFAASYALTWGLSKDVSRPVVGNHEYGTSKAAGYFSYFGSSAGVQGSGYYSYDVGAWHVVAINTECTRIDGGVGCAVGSPQEVWLKNDLASHPSACTLVYGHRPRWSSSSFASADIAPLFDDMVTAHVDLYLSGHAHSYERFAPQDASGAPKADGLTAMVVGTGGSFYTGTGTIAPNSVVRKTNLFGVEKVVLHPGSWDYTYKPENSTFTDSGSGTCH